MSKSRELVICAFLIRHQHRCREGEKYLYSLSNRMPTQLGVNFYKTVDDSKFAFHCNSLFNSADSIIFQFFFSATASSSSSFIWHTTRIYLFHWYSVCLSHLSCPIHSPYMYTVRVQIQHTFETKCFAKSILLKWCARCRLVQQRSISFLYFDVFSQLGYR